MSNRKLKVYSKSFPLADYQYHTVPEMRLSGVWLEKSGFVIGDQVELIVNEGQIIIRNIEKRK